jgi:copper homeostasis protein
MREDLIHARELGAAGFVLGILNADRTVDVARTRELIELAAPLEVTFHRAFDRTASLDQALEEVISTGCRRVLTSGGKPNVATGAQALARLVELSSGRIVIAAGGGLRLSNAAVVARTSNAPHFHGSVRMPTESGQMTVSVEDIRALIDALST